MAKAKAAKTATPQSKGSKKDTKVKQAAVKAETKTKIVKEESNSSEEESSSDEEDVPAKVNGAATPAASKATVVTPAEEDSSSEEESSSDEETATPAKAAESSSSEEESSDEEEATPVAAAAAESSEEESSSDEEEATPSKKVAAKAESSEEETSSGEESFDEEEATPAASVKTNQRAAATKATAAAATADDSSEEESSDEEESSADEATVPAAKATAAAEESSSEEESSEEESSDEEMTETANAAETVKTNKRKAADISKAVEAAKPLGKTVSSSSGEEEESSEEEGEEQPVKKSKKNDGKAEPKAAEKSGVDASAANGSRTIFCKNLPWTTTDEDLAGFFADCGEVTECRIAYDRDTGRAKGFAHIQFESVEAAAKAIGMSGQNVGGRDIFIDTAQERTGGGGGGAGAGGGFERPQRNQFSDTEGTTIFVKGFDKYLGEDAIREQLTAAFADCGEVSNVRLPSDRESGELKGIGFIEFATTDAKNKAGEFDGTEAAGGYLKVDLNPGGGRGGGRGDRGGRGGFGGGRGGGRGFGGGRGRDGGRGGRGGFRGGRGGDRGGRGGGRGRGDFKPKMKIDAGSASGSKVTFD